MGGTPSTTYEFDNEFPHEITSSNVNTYGRLARSTIQNAQYSSERETIINHVLFRPTEADLIFIIKNDECLNLYISRWRGAFPPNLGELVYSNKPWHDSPTRYGFHLNEIPFDVDKIKQHGETYLEYELSRFGGGTGHNTRAAKMIAASRRDHVFIGTPREMHILEYLIIYHSHHMFSLRPATRIEEFALVASNNNTNISIFEKHKWYQRAILNHYNIKYTTPKKDHPSIPYWNERTHALYIKMRTAMFCAILCAARASCAPPAELLIKIFEHWYTC